MHVLTPVTITEAQRKFLIRWVGYGPEHDHWLAGSTLQDFKGLDVWQEKEASGAATQQLFPINLIHCIYKYFYPHFVLEAVRV